MSTPIADRFAAFPTPAAGLALGIAGLAWCWEVQVPTDGAVQAAGALVAAAIAACVVLKFVLHPRILWAELEHPVIGSVAPTLAMASQVISLSLGWLSPAAGTALWLAAVAVHLAFLVLFAAHRAREPHLTHMVPSWYVPPIGVVVAVMTTPAPEFRWISFGLLWFGIGAYAVMLPLMLHRLIFRDTVPVAARPTIAILAAPPNLCLSGYLIFSREPDFMLVLVLLSIGILMAVVVYLAFFELLRLPFGPGYAAFTFPAAISATAGFKATAYFQSVGVSTEVLSPLRHWAMIELAIATAIIGYVALRYALHYGRAAVPQPAVAAE